MATILCIESATKVCSVALFQNGVLKAIKEQGGQYSHAENLAVFVDELLKSEAIKPNDLDAIAVSEGPGSYTGLRIGVALAKGMCYSLEIPLIAIPTLKAMAYGAISKANKEDLYYIPMIDARRMEVYRAVYNSKLETIEDTAAEVLETNSFAQLQSSKKVYCFGDGASKFNELTESDAFLFSPALLPSAQFMGELAQEKWDQKDFVNLAYFEPFYLKEFQTSSPKK